MSNVSLSYDNCSGSSTVDDISYYDYEDPWPKQDLFLLGFVCMIPILIGLPIYAMVLYFFTFSHEFNSQLSYRMMVYYGIADMLQMCYYVYWGVTMLFYTVFDYEISVITDSIYYSAWTLVNLMIFLVAMNRFDVFVPIPIELNRKIAFNVIAVAFVLIALGQAILGLIPGFRMYSLRPMSLTYEAGMLAAYWYFDRINYIALSGAVILYFISFVSVVIKRRILTISTTKLLTKIEVKMLLQTVIPCLVKTSLAAVLDFDYPQDRLGIAIITFITFLEASYTPFLYLLVNKSLRMRIKKLCASNKNSTVLVKPFSTKVSTITHV